MSSSRVAASARRDLTSARNSDATRNWGPDRSSINAFASRLNCTVLMRNTVAAARDDANPMLAASPQKPVNRNAHHGGTETRRRCFAPRHQERQRRHGEEKQVREARVWRG